MEKKRFIVSVDTGGSAYSYLTYCEDIFHNFKFGNEPMIFFETIGGEKVAIPGRFLVTHKELK